MNVKQKQKSILPLFWYYIHNPQLLNTTCTDKLWEKKKHCISSYTEFQRTT